MVAPPLSQHPGCEALAIPLQASLRPAHLACPMKLAEIARLAFTLRMASLVLSVYWICYHSPNKKHWSLMWLDKFFTDLHMYMHLCLHIHTYVYNVYIYIHMRALFMFFDCYQHPPQNFQIPLEMPLKMSPKPPRALPKHVPRTTL